MLSRLNWSALIRRASFIAFLLRVSSLPRRVYRKAKLLSREVEAMTQEPEHGKRPLRFGEDGELQAGLVNACPEGKMVVGHIDPIALRVKADGHLIQRPQGRVAFGKYFVHLVLHGVFSRARRARARPRSLSTQTVLGATQSSAATWRTGRSSIT